MLCAILSFNMIDFTESNYISYNISRFLETKKLTFLIKAIYLAFIQKRTRELLFGYYNFIFHKPSCIRNETNHPIDGIIDEVRDFVTGETTYSRETLISKFKNNYAVNLIPLDFTWARAEAVLESNNVLIIGEYGAMSKRILYINNVICKTCKFYDKDDDVTHIHAINNYTTEKNILITTGDAGKYLDLWCVIDGDIVFKKRLRKKLAGYSAMTTLNKNCYFGTDFSSRPNYIETLNNTKYYFPDKAYKMFVNRFAAIQNRFIVSVNIDLLYFGGRQTISIFDSHLKEFIFCEYIDRIPRFIEKENPVHRPLYEP
jgi:hypothetical protein